MLSSDREIYNTTFDEWCAGMGVIATDARREGYWKGLAKMSLIQFTRVVEHCLSEEGPDKFPTVPAIWKLWRAISAKARQGSMPPPRAPEPQSQGLRLINGLFLKYLARRRLAQEFKGDISIRARRTICLDLAQWLDGAIAEQMAPSDSELATIFDKAMDRIPDLSQDLSWLPIELLRQRQEDQAKRAGQ